MVPCPHCGFENPESTKHCTACGKPVTAPPVGPDLGSTVRGVGAFQDGAEKKKPDAPKAGAAASAAVDLRATRLGVGPSEAVASTPRARPVGAVATPIASPQTPPTREAPAVVRGEDIDPVGPTMADTPAFPRTVESNAVSRPQSPRGDADSGPRRLPARPVREPTPMRPPVLASDSLRAELRPVEPGRAVMRAALCAGGAVLLMQLLCPWGRTPHGVLFAWGRLALLSGLDLAVFAYALVGGIGMLLLGALDVSYRARALGGAALGTIPLMFAAVGSGDMAFSASGARGLLLAFSIDLCAGALFYRANYRESVLARVLVAVGVLLGLAWLFLPDGDAVPLFAELGSLHDVLLVIRLWMFALLGFLLLALLAFMGSGTTGGARWWAALMIGWIPGLLLIQALWSSANAAEAALNLPRFHAVVSSTVYTFVATYGLAQTLAAASNPIVPGDEPVSSPG